MVDRARSILAEAQEEAETLLEAAREHLRREIAATDAKDHLMRAKLYLELAETYGGPRPWEDEAAVLRAFEPLSLRERIELEDLLVKITDARTDD